jgi:hypothetical protein
VNLRGVALAAGPGAGRTARAFCLQQGGTPTVLFLSMPRERPTLLARLARCLPWLVLAVAAAFGLGLSAHAAMNGAQVGPTTPTLMLRTFALVIGAMGTVRSLHATRRRIGEVRWLGLPPRDWAFAGGFAVTASGILWIATA